MIVVELENAKKNLEKVLTSGEQEEGHHAAVELQALGTQPHSSSLRTSVIRQAHVE
jgi:hypothetical protein